MDKLTLHANADNVNTVKSSVFNNDVLRPFMLADELTALACECPSKGTASQPLSALKNTMAALVSKKSYALTLVAGKPMRILKLKVSFQCQFIFSTSPV